MRAIGVLVRIRMRISSMKNVRVTAHMGVTMKVATHVMAKSAAIVPQAKQRQRELAHEYRAAHNRRDEK